VAPPITRRALLRTLPLVTLLACAGPGASTPPASADLSWLVGAWRTESEGPVTVESWTMAADGSLVGESVTREGGLRVHGELLSITTEPRALRAAPSGQPPHTFPLVEVGPRRVLFADPTHDWPHYVQYERDGDRLIATVWGEADDRPPAVWSFILVP
jgi:hypothetical protein